MKEYRGIRFHSEDEAEAEDLDRLKRDGGMLLEADALINMLRTAPEPGKSTHGVANTLLLALAFLIYKDGRELCSDPDAHGDADMLRKKLALGSGMALAALVEEMPELIRSATTTEH